jgi:hypothetical protein
MDYLLSAVRQAAGTLTEAGIIFFLRGEINFRTEKMQREQPGIQRAFFSEMTIRLFTQLMAKAKIPYLITPTLKSGATYCPDF